MSLEDEANDFNAYMFHQTHPQHEEKDEFEQALAWSLHSDDYRVDYDMFRRLCETLVENNNKLKRRIRLLEDKLNKQTTVNLWPSLGDK